MNAATSLPLEQHNIEIQRNREAWAKKPFLQEIYRSFYRQIAAQIDPRLPGSLVELGSGIGAIKEVIPGCITTDLFPNPWLDRQENAYQLNFPDHCISHLILFDVWHHLRYPGTALKEFQRVLVPGGRLILFEPAASWTGRIVYRLFHHEPVGLRVPITWNAPSGFSSTCADYFAAQGAASRIFWWGEGKENLRSWHLREMRPITSFSYMASGGFSGPQIGGRFAERLGGFLDRTLSRFPRLFASRLLVVLEKELN